MTNVPVTLALKELRHDWQAAACFIAALVGMLAPLLIILALKNGVIATLLGQLVDDPSNRELIAIGAGRRDAAFFETLQEAEEVAFVMPATRSINAVANAVRHRAARKLVRKVTLIPSAPGDPLTDDATVVAGEVLLTDRLAEDLEAGPGDTVEIRVERRLDDRPETATRDLVVSGIVPAERFSRAAMFISLPDLIAIERFRDDATIGPGDWATDPPDAYASFRIYASGLADIAPLEARLAAMGAASRPRAQNVELLLSFRRSLNLLFAVIAALAVAGFWAAMAANLRGMVERQRVSLSLLALIGLGEGSRRMIPVAQSLVLVLGGVTVTLALVLPMLLLINRVFAPDGMERIAWLGPAHLGAMLALGVVTSLTASIWAVTAIKEIGPDEVLRSN